jgi:tetratricopeptide (TPR) repeat protein
MYNFEKKRLPMLDILLKEKGVSFKKEEMNYLYNIAVKKCTVGEYEKALEILQFLNLLEPANSMYMKATGGALQGLGQYREAYQMFQGSYILNQKNKSAQVECLFYMAHCAIKQDKYDLAKKLLTSFLEDSEESELRKKAVLLLKGVEKKLNPKDSETTENTNHGSEKD